MSDIIQLLPDSIANQIAAGEVIQRPASVVKELLENSIDAGSTEIRLILKDAGKTLVQVVDNGAGMTEMDARMCFERHATSKIRSADDLFHIRTMGFRGEALASIASIARVELKTIREEMNVGTRILISGSKIEKQEADQVNQGTSIAVKNLFFNVPARRKFLKSDPVELRHILDEFTRIALAYPEIFFSCHHNDAELYHLPKGNLRQRIVSLFGKKINELLVPVKEETEMVRFEGFIGKPEYAKKTRGEQFLFVNNRFIKSNYLNHAIRSAFEDLIPEDHHPFYVVFMEIDPERIDVNVHPTKQEIKFQDERLIYNYLKVATRHALGQYSLSPILDFEQEHAVRRMERGEIPSGYQRPERPDSAWTDLYEGLDAEAIRIRDNAAATGHQSHIFTDKGPDTFAESGAGSMQIQESARDLFQIAGRYIVSPIKSGIMLVDPNAALERIWYEHFMDKLDNGDALVQQALFPKTFDCAPADLALMGEILPVLNKLGFDVQEFGHGTYIIHGIPASFDGLELSEELVIQDTLAAYREDRDEKDGRKRVAWALARSSAGRGSRRLQKEEMQSLVDQLFACESPYATPGGKRCFITIDIAELERRFQ